MSKITFNWFAYWERHIPQPLWVERLDNFISENQDLDYFSLSVEGADSRCREVENYARFTVEQFKFEKDFQEYYGV